MDVATLRSFLFVPATRPERILKALASGADAVIVDLEDAVALDDKAKARQALDDFLTATPNVQVMVRINSVDSPECDQDLVLCVRHAGVVGVMLPKAESSAQVERVHAASGKPVWPLIETASGVLGLPKLVEAPGVVRLSIGALDMTADLALVAGSTGGEQLLNHCRYQLVLCSRAAGLAPPIESVVPDIQDLDSVARVAKRSVEMGFGGMLCIHPRQLTPIHQAFAPDEAELAWARRVLAGAGAAGGAVFQLDGQMVDAPVIARARRVLGRGGA